MNEENTDQAIREYIYMDTPLTAVNVTYHVEDYRHMVTSPANNNNLRDFDTGSGDYYSNRSDSHTHTESKPIEFIKDGKEIGKLFIENNSLKFSGDLDNSAVLLFDMVRKMHSKYINQIYYALGTYTDSPNRDGLYLADSIITNLDKPFPFTETQKILV